MLLHAHLRIISLAAMLAGSICAADEGTVTITLPTSSELDKLAEIVSQATQISLQYHPQKLTGTVNLAIREPLSRTQLWSVFNQVLAGQGFTTVLSGSPEIYAIVTQADAAGLSAVMAASRLDTLSFPPGFAVVSVPLTHLGPDLTAKTLGTLFSGQTGQVRALGDRELLIAAPLAQVREAQRLLLLLDRPGAKPHIQLYRPTRATPQTLQAAALQAWAAYGRIAGADRPADIQIAPDGSQVQVVASVEDSKALLDLISELDRSDPVETKTYRPAFFSIDEVARLMGQLLKPESPGGRGMDIVRDPLTNSLIVTATAAQHARMAEVLRTLDETPASSRRQLRTFVIKNRQVDEVSQVIADLLDSGVTSADESTSGMSQPAPAESRSPRPPPAPTAPDTPPTPRGDERQSMAAEPSGSATQWPQGTVSTRRSKDASVVMTADPATNHLICLGEPRTLDQIETLLKQLDKRQPQVELDVILVTLSSNENRDLGVEIAARITRGEMSATVSSLFGLSAAPAAGDVLARQLGNAAGFGGVVINPGDYAGVVRALETTASGRSLIRSRVVVVNNGKATINGVVQEPVTSINSGDQVATTSYSGTSDAGTQLALEPQISAGDHVTLAYAITQSAFLGDSTVTANGGVIPPTKRTDSVSSVATIPDGFVIALGGLSNRSDSHSESRLPFLGKLPFLGHLFKSQSKGANDSRFYVFIRANVLRHASFADLRRLAQEQTADLPQVPNRPSLKPEMMR